MASALVIAFRVTLTAARRLVVVSMLIEVVAAVALALQLVMLSVLLERLLSPSQPFDDLSIALWPMLGVVLALLVGRVAVAVVRELRWPISEIVAASIERGVVATVSAAPLLALDDAEFHNRIERARADAADQVWSMVSGSVALARGLLATFAVGFVLLRTAPELVIIGLAGLVPTAATLSIVARRRYHLYTELTENDRERDYLVDLLTGRPGGKETRLYRLAWSLLPRYERLVDQRISRVRADARRRIVLLAIGDVMALVILTAALLFALDLVAQQRITAADGGVAVAALFQLVGTLAAAGSGAVSLREAAFHVAEHQRFVSGTEEIRPRETPSTFDTIEFDKVWFQYPGAASPVIQDLSFELTRGQILVVRGPNGAGKSTLISLVCGLIEPTQGTIRLDGAAADGELLRSVSSALFQDFLRLEFEVGTGVGVEDRSPRAALVEQAIDSSGSRAIVGALDGGVHRRLGRSFRDGHELSSGQWQRLAVARALYNTAAPLVVLDEPTSMQDAHSTRHLLETIRGIARDRTVVLVTHQPLNDLAPDVTITFSEHDPTPAVNVRP